MLFVGLSLTRITGVSFCFYSPLLLKSKCQNFSCCWGFMSIERNVDIEAQEEMRALELGVRTSPKRSQSLTGF